MAIPITPARRGMWSKPASERDRRIVSDFEAAKARILEMAGAQRGLWRRLKLAWAARRSRAGTAARN